MAASRFVDVTRARNSIYGGEVSLLFWRWERQTYNFKIFMKENMFRVARL